VCSVPEREGMECNGSVPRSRDGSDHVFGSERNEERNGSILCSVGGSGTERNSHNHGLNMIFLSKSKLTQP
jgi:hypothetical protein